MKIYQKIIVIGLICMQSLLVLAQVAPINTFVGPGTDWNDSANWSAGLVPVSTDAVIIATGQSVIMTGLGTPAAPYMLASIVGESSSTLEIRQSIVEVAGIIDGDLVATLALVESSMANAGVNSNPTSKAQKDTPVINPWSGMRLNPSQMVVNGDAQLASTGLIFVLGGDQAASAGNTGVGFYGNLDVQNITLGAALVIETKYGFQPQVGDSFMIVDVSGTRTGAFSGVTEGDIVASFNGVDLTLSYIGGDGNDVVLETVLTPNTFVGPGTDWSDSANWSSGLVPVSTDAAIIATGQSVIMTGLGTPAAPYMLASIVGKSSSTLEIRQSIVEVAGIIDGDLVATLAWLNRQ